MKDGGRIEQNTRGIDRYGQLVSGHAGSDVFGEARTEQQPSIRVADRVLRRRYLYGRSELHIPVKAIQR